MHTKMQKVAKKISETKQEVKFAVSAKCLLWDSLSKIIC